MCLLGIWIQTTIHSLHSSSRSFIYTCFLPSTTFLYLHVFCLLLGHLSFTTFSCNHPVLDEMPKLNKAYSYENQWENTKRNMEKKGEKVCLKWRGGQNNDNICKLHQLLYSDYRFSTQVIIKRNKAKNYSPSSTKRVYVGQKIV